MSNQQHTRLDPEQLKKGKTFFATDWAVRNKTAVYLITLFVTIAIACPPPLSPSS